MNKKLLAFILFVSIGVNFFLIAVYFSRPEHFRSETKFEALAKKYPLLSKRILQEYPIDVIINFLDLRKELHDQVAPYGDSFGFYFEYLPTGTSIGVNEKLDFYAASLFKVPVVMAYYHQKERLSLSDDPEIELKEEDLESDFGDLHKKGAGYKIKTSELVRLALEKSDNTAAKAIASRTKVVDFDEVYGGLDIDLKNDENGAILTAKSYSSILKALYFSSVLKKENSQEILEYLTRSDFNDKLVAGVDPNIKVAHKIGGFLNKNTNDRAYMDCGIVYLPKRPYLLCMVSEGDEVTARTRMKKLSSTIYNYLTATD